MARHDFTKGDTMTFAEFRKSLLSQWRIVIDPVATQQLKFSALQEIAWITNLITDTELLTYMEKTVCIFTAQIP